MLTLDALSLTAADRAHLDNLTLQVGAGEIAALVGKSGSGKSSLAQVLGGRPPRGTRAGGQVQVGELSLTDNALGRLAKIGPDQLVVVSDALPGRLAPRRPIGPQLAATVQQRDGTDEETAMAVARSLCERMGLDMEADLERKRPFQLDAGPRFLVELANALALRPKVLVADDPNVALDLLQLAHLLDALRLQADEDGLAVLYLTRNLPAAAKIADDLGIMDAGRLIEMDQTDRLLRNPQQPATDRLVRAAVHRRRAAKRPDIPRARPVLAVREVVLDDVQRVGGAFSAKRHLRLLDNVSFEVGPGECMGVIGVSRRALSALCDVVCAERAATEGRVILSGARMSPDMDATQKRRVQRIGANPFRAGQNRQKVSRFIEESLHTQVLSEFERDLKVGEVLNDFGLGRGLAGAMLGSLDAPTRHKVALARAVLARPDLIVFEDPTSWLDLLEGDAFLDLMAAMQARHGFAMLVTSRGFHALRAVAHQVVVLDGGRIIESGETEQVFRHPTEPHTVALVDAQPILSDVLVTH